jgi:small subunit ribosomal protein S19e
MANIYDVPQGELTEKAAVELKKIAEVSPPEWAQLVKTGPSKERPPARKDWWYVRSASILKKLYVLGPIGVSKLRKNYGSKKNRGAKPSKFYNSSGNILRKILQQLEKAGLAKQVEKHGHKGRVLTPKGVSLMDKVASKIVGTKKKPSKPVEAKKPETKPNTKVETKSEVKPEAQPKKTETKAQK